MSGHNAQSVSAGLRSATAVAHDRAERAHFVDDLMSGRLDAAGYLRMAVQLYFIYRALESVGDELSGEEVAGAVVDERLRGLPGLTADLAAVEEGPNTITP